MMQDTARGAAGRAAAPGWRRLALAVTAIAVAGCAVSPKPITDDEVARRVTDDRARLHADQEPVRGPMGFADVAARVLKYNLEHRVRMMETALAQSQLAVGQWDMFPQLVASAGYLNRNNELQYVNNGVASTTTLERTRRVAGLEFSWNILDFGVSYYRAKVLADQVMIAEERKRKAVQNLMQDARIAYWRALGAQRLGDRLDELMKRANVALARARMIEQQGLLPKTQALAYQRALLDATTLLQLRRQDIDVAKVELAALMNLPHGTAYNLLDEREPDLPPAPARVERLEDIALAQRPELREEDYRRRITANETRRAIASALPGISFSTGWNHDSNRFLLNNSWVETGLRVSANLFKIASIPTVRRAGETQTTVDDARRLAQAMAVLTQVRVAALRYDLAKDELKQAEESARVDLRLANYTKASASSRVDSELEKIRTEARSLLSDYQRHISFANAQAAWGRLYNSIGYDVAPTDSRADLATLSRSIRDSLNRWHRNTFDLTPRAALPPVYVAVEGPREPAMADSVRAGVVDALQRAGLSVSVNPASAWRLKVGADFGVGADGRRTVDWKLALVDVRGTVVSRATYSTRFATAPQPAALRALSESALDAYLVTMTDRIAQRSLDLAAAPR